MPDRSIVAPLALAAALALAACGSSRTGADDPGAPTALARQACQRILALHDQGCAVATVPDMAPDGCVAGIIAEWKQHPKSLWIPQCFVDHDTCDQVKACLSGPPGK